MNLNKYVYKALILQKIDTSTLDVKKVDEPMS